MNRWGPSLHCSLFSPKLTQPPVEPAYLKSETLRLIKESESRSTSGAGDQSTIGQKGIPFRMVTPTPPEPPRIEPRPSPENQAHLYQSKSFIRLTQALAVEDEPGGAKGANGDVGKDNVQSCSMDFQIWV